MLRPLCMIPLVVACLACESGLAQAAEARKFGLDDLSWGASSATWTSPEGQEIRYIPFPFSGDMTHDNAAVVDVRAYPGTDLGAQFNAAIAALPATGGMVLIPPGTYTTATELSIPITKAAPVVVWAAGATIRTVGAISGLKISGYGNHGRTIYNLTIDHQNNADATYGVNIVRGTNVRLYNPTIVAKGTSAKYAAIRLANLTANIDDTGSFWTKIISPRIAMDTGGASNIPFGILLEGAANATHVFGGSISNCDKCIFLRNQTSNGALPNGVRIDGVDFESYGTAIGLSGNAASPFMGPVVSNCRFESGTTIFSVTGITAQPQVPPLLYGNQYVYGSGTYIHNPNNLHINTFDFSITPVLGTGPHLHGMGPMIFESLDYTKPALETRVQGNTPGEAFRVSLHTGNSLWNARYIASGKFQLDANYAGGVSQYFTGVGGISRAATRAENLRGAVTFASAGTATVSFAVNEANTSYFIALGCNAHETFWWSAKTVSGFTINSSNATSTATCDWILIR